MSALDTSQPSVVFHYPALPDTTDPGAVRQHLEELAREHGQFVQSVNDELARLQNLITGGGS